MKAAIPRRITAVFIPATTDRDTPTPVSINSHAAKQAGHLGIRKKAATDAAQETAFSFDILRVRLQKFLAGHEPFLVGNDGMVCFRAH